MLVGVYEWRVGGWGGGVVWIGMGWWVQEDGWVVVCRVHWWCVGWW